MHGSWVIVRMKNDKPGKAKNAWLRIKHRDAGAVEGEDSGPTAADVSVASGRTMDEIAAGKGPGAEPFMTDKGADAGAVWNSDHEDPAPAAPERKSRAKPGTKAASALPRFVEPQQTKLRD